MDFSGQSGWLAGYIIGLVGSPRRRGAGGVDPGSGLAHR